MMKPTIVLFTLAVYSLEPSPVTGREIYVQRLPNGGNVAGAPAVGHSDKTGHSSSLNAFGRAFGNAGLKWTTTLCQADSDGDGQTNGQELGDPCCTWTSGATPKFTSGVSNPGDASSKVSTDVLTTYSCQTGGSTAAPSPTDATTTPASTSTATSTPTPTTASTGTASSFAMLEGTSSLALLVGVVASVVAGVAALGYR